MGEINKGKSPIPKQVSIELLSKVCAVLNENGIDYFLTCGTLLGYIREGDFIEWDSDIDLGVFEIKAFESVIPKLQACSLTVKKFSPEHGIRMSLSYQITDPESRHGPHSHVDIFEFEKTSQGILFRMAGTRKIVERSKWFLLSKLSGYPNEETVDQGSVEVLLQGSSLPSRIVGSINKIKSWARRNLFLRQYKHIFVPFIPVEVSWFDIPVKIPSNPEDHLRLLYGDNWRIPNRDYAQSLERQNNIRRIKL